MTPRGKFGPPTKIFFAPQFDARGAAKPRTCLVKHLTPRAPIAATCYSQPAASVGGEASEKSRCKSLAFAKLRA
jgi:hypothetical protein